MRLAPALPALLLLASCGEGEVARPAHLPAPPVAVPARVSGPYAEAPPRANPGVIPGQSARALIAAYGQPRLDVQEGKGRKLQFAGSACVLDVYLYPRGRGDAVATHYDARLRDGRPAEAGACIATLGGR
ncbi:hypothetical protein [Sphingomonas sp.]|uniref:hypothetical protein n=1 Tax=Sphingomonas sp. TaxID=28214 RepID=UPI001B0FF749|nr:hypothetical protein [Sphingomonas sp.]MBO9714505.1 hypothetical protein [Sphingomonas sp.]